MKMLNKKRIVCAMLCCLLFTSMTIQSNAAVTSNSVKSVMSGWSVASNKPTNVKMDSRKTFGFDNSKHSKPFYGCGFNKEFISQTSTGGSLSSEISADMKLKATKGPGEISGGLAAKVQATANYNFARTEAERVILDFKKNPVPPKKKLIVSTYTTAKQVTGYAKKYTVWIPTKSGHFTVTTPECIMFTYDLI